MCSSYYNKSTSGSLSALSQSSSCFFSGLVFISGHGLPRSGRVRRGGRASAGEGGGEAGSGVRLGQPHRFTRRRIIRRAQQEIAGRRRRSSSRGLGGLRIHRPPLLGYTYCDPSASMTALALTPPACFTAWIHTCASLSSPCCTPPPAIVLPPHQPVRVLSHLHATSPSSPRVALPPHLHPCTSSTSVTTSFTHRKLPSLSLKTAVRRHVCCCPRQEPHDSSTDCCVSSSLSSRTAAVPTASAPPAAAAAGARPTR